MGTYTHVRGWISIDSLDFTKDMFEELMKLAIELSPRADQCIICTVFNAGFDFSNYIFIGGQIKNYDGDWDIFLSFLRDNLKINNYHLEMKYEEDDDWSIIDLDKIKTHRV